MVKLWVACVLFCVVTTPAWAGRKWQAVDIPGARCGDGSQYQVMLSRGDAKRISFDLMGGGACWNFQTCFGPTPLAWVHGIPGVWERDGFTSDDPAASPAAGDTIVYFPYCTGDVHVGDHVASYPLGTKVYHWGKRNFETAVAFLQSQGLINLREADRFIMYGYSAGAIGALFHAATIEPYLVKAQHKILLADSPGLHFGDRFWTKFSPEFLHDFEQGFKRAGLALDRSHGNIARLVPRLCALLPDWQVAVLQGSRDIIMSSLFGSLSPTEHEKLVYGPEGIYSLTAAAGDNCAAWVPSSAMHTFLISDFTGRIKTADGLSAMDFAFETIGDGAHRNHR